MTIVYPLTIPTPQSPGGGTVRPSSFKITASTLVALSRSTGTFSQQAYKKDAEGWLIELNYSDMSAECFREFQAFVCALRGRYGTFYWGDYLQGTPRGTPAGTPLVENGGASVGEWLYTKGWTPNTLNVMRKGDWIQLGDRLHMVLSDHHSDGTGKTRLDIFPIIRTEGVTTNQEVITQDCQGVFRLVENDIQWSISEAGTYSFSLTAMEAL